MASTLAHELNQPLTAIANYLKGSRRLLDSGQSDNVPKISEALERAAEQALRAGQIIRQLREFVARGESDRQIENLPRLIEEASALALVGVQELGVHVAFDLDPRGDIRSRRQNSGRTGAVEFDAQCDRGHAGNRSGSLLTVSTRKSTRTVRSIVTDTGPGIAQEIAAQLFQPFVTTKGTAWA